MRGCVIVLSGYLAVCALTGCYQRTVYAQGMGAERYAVQKPYRSETTLDKWFDSEIMGKKPVKRRPGGTVSTVAPAPSNAARKSWTTPPQ